MIKLLIATCITVRSVFRQYFRENFTIQSFSDSSELDEPKKPFLEFCLCRDITETI